MPSHASEANASEANASEARLGDDDNMSAGARALGRATAQRVGAIAGLSAFVLSLIGFGMLGDTPDPHDAAKPLAAYFVEHRTAMFTSMVLVALAGIAIIIFVSVLCGGLADGVALRIAYAAGLGIVAILMFNELIYVALAYSIGRDDPSTAKSLFALTILSPVLLGPLVALLLGTVAVRRGTFPRWFAYVSAIGAVLVIPAAVSFGDSGFLSPDVQQQVVAQVFLLWLLVASIVVWRSPLRQRDFDL
jgi:hypothetical protein